RPWHHRPRSRLVTGREEDRLRLGPRRQLRDPCDERRRNEPDAVEEPMKPLFAVCAVALLTLDVWAGDGAGTVRSPDQIAFASTRQGGQQDKPDIYLMNDDGTQVTNLTKHAGRNFAPAWSPDGTKIAFCSNRDGKDEIYVMNADGSGPTRLTHSAAIDEAPDWSPDGTKIAFESHRAHNHEIYVMNADGSD